MDETSKRELQQLFAENIPTVLLALPYAAEVNRRMGTYAEPRHARVKILCRNATDILDANDIDDLKKGLDESDIVETKIAQLLIRQMRAGKT